MILVTGGTGLVGSHLVYHLIEAGETPVVLKRSTSDISMIKRVFSYYSNDSETLFSKIKWVDGDICDYNSVLDAMEGIDHVYHTAAKVSFHSSDKESVISTNIVGTTNIVNAAIEKNIKKLVYVSSIGALGRAIDGVVTEDSHWNSKKSSIYSTSKHHAEMEVWRGIAEGLNAVIVNPSIILGPGDWKSGSSKLFTTMYKGLKFYSKGTNGFVDVNDVAKCMILLMNKDIAGDRFILNSENISYKNFFYWMADALGVAPPKYEAARFLSELGWRLLWLRGIIIGKIPTITRETAETANQYYQYSNDKIIENTGIKFIPVKESIKINSAFFLQSCNN